MARAALFALLASSAPLAFAQGGIASTGFQYMGCVEAANPNAFPVRAPSTGGINSFTAIECQNACKSIGAAHAALGHGGCFCDDPKSRTPAGNFKNIGEQFCHTACKKGDPRAGNCGGCVDKPVYNLYMRSEDVEQAAKAVAPEPCDDDVPAAPPAKPAVVEPATKEVAPAPATKEVAPAPATKEVAPAPATKAAAPEPSTKAAITAPATKAAAPPAPVTKAAEPSAPATKAVVEPATKAAAPSAPAAKAALSTGAAPPATHVKAVSTADAVAPAAKAAHTAVPVEREHEPKERLRNATVTSVHFSSRTTTVVRASGEAPPPAHPEAKPTHAQNGAVNSPSVMGSAPGRCPSCMTTALLGLGAFAFALVAGLL